MNQVLANAEAQDHDAGLLDSEFENMLLDDIHPSPHYEKFHGPILETDPAIIELAASIRSNGIQEALALTLDNCIIKGHKRYVAARMAGLVAVPCYHSEIASDNPRFLRFIEERDQMPAPQPYPTFETDASGSFRRVRKRVASLIPAPENEILYKKINPGDPEIIELAESIKKHGCVDLMVSEDNYILSGNRRRAALRLIGRVFTWCLVLPVRWLELEKDHRIKILRSHNRQREKSVAEQVREAMIDIDPEDAYGQMLCQRDKSICAAEENGVETLAIEGVKKRHGISKQKAAHVEHIKKVVFTDRKDYWPLSVRGVHYGLMNYEFLRNIPQELPYKNDDDSYGATSNLITRMRLNGTLPWRAFDDVTRPFKEFFTCDDAKDFVRQEVDGFLTGYRRNLMQSQGVHIELLCEKNTIYHMVLRVAEKYQIPTSSGRGFNSIDPWHDLCVRYKNSGKKRLIVIVLSDYDPEGEQIPQVGGRTIRDDFFVPATDFKIIKAGVTREQITRYKLPSQNFAKESSGNLKWFVERNGGDDAVYELEALPPEGMLGDLDQIIRSVIDIELFNKEVAIEKEESRFLVAAKKTAANALKGLGK